jgi:hypothetical protein
MQQVLQVRVHAMHASTPCLHAGCGYGCGLCDSRACRISLRCSYGYVDGRECTSFAACPCIPAEIPARWVRGSQAMLAYDSPAGLGIGSAILWPGVCFRHSNALGMLICPTIPSLRCSCCGVYMRVVVAMSIHLCPFVGAGSCCHPQIIIAGVGVTPVTPQRVLCGRAFGFLRGISPATGPVGWTRMCPTQSNPMCTCACRVHVGKLRRLGTVVSPNQIAQDGDTAPPKS